jgi:SAM-dependent methyltransferase
MTVLDIIQRQPTPVPWAEGDKIPWNDPEFSKRMLREHLSQRHNAASRRFEVIDRHVEWIHNTVLKKRPTRILDLGCGPGFYANRLAALGHECLGIDFSPASIEYARNTAEKQHASCTFVHQDIRNADYGIGYGLGLLVYGELNVFTSAAAELILRKAHAALADDGVLVLEPHTFAAVQHLGQAPNSWYSSTSGLFSEWPHLYFQENFWDEECAAATIRYFVLDAASSDVVCYASSMQAYTNEQYRRRLETCGFQSVQFYSSLLGATEQDHDPEMAEAHRYLLAIVARKS